MLKGANNSGNLAGWKYLFDALAWEDFQKAADESHRDDNHGKNGNIKKEMLGFIVKYYRR